VGIYTAFNKLFFMAALGLFRAMSYAFIVGETKRIVLKVELECSSRKAPKIGREERRGSA
jgi:hypothetical protein